LSRFDRFRPFEPFFAKSSDYSTLLQTRIFAARAYIIMLASKYLFWALALEKRQ